MKRKRILLCILCSVLLLFSMSVLSVHAHPGGTDSNGGHRDRTTGEYHYHHGYEAHDHYDVDGDGVIDCPFDFDDQTGVNSGTSSKNSISGDKYQIIIPPNFPIFPSYPLIDIPETPTPHQSSIDNDSETKGTYYTPPETSTPNAQTEIKTFFFFSSLIALSFFILIKLRDFPKSKSTDASNISSQITTTQTTHSQPSHRNMQANISQSNEALSFCDFFNVDDPGFPSDIHFIDGYIPVKGNVTSDKPYGDFTVYVTLNGKRYHRNRACPKSVIIAMHIYETGFRYSPCSKCAAGTNNHAPEWYRKARDIVNNHK